MNMTVCFSFNCKLKLLYGVYHCSLIRCLLLYVFYNSMS